MAIAKTVLRNILSNWVGYAVGVIVSFFLSPFVVHKLGNVGYGIWVLVGSLTGYLGILDFGIRPAIVKFVSRYNALGDNQNVNKIINTTLVVFSVVAVVVVLASIILASLSDTFFKVPEEYHHELFAAIILVGISVALSFPFGVFNATLNALQRFDINNIIQISVFLLRALAILIFLKLGGGIVTLSVIVIVATLVEFSLKAVSCTRVLPTLVISPRLASRETLKQITGFSVYTFIMGIALRFAFQADSIIIGAIISAEAITFYAIAASMMDYVTSLISNVTVTLTPVASTYEAHGDVAKLRELLIIGTKYCLLLILPVGCVYVLLGKTFIDLWMGPQYGSVSGPILIILMIAYVGYLSQFVANSIFYALGVVRTLAFTVLGVSVLKVILSAALGSVFGIEGVAFGTAIPLLVFGMVFQPIYVCRLVNLRLFDYLRRSYVPPLIACGPLLLILLLASKLTTIDSLVKFGFVVFIPFCVYLATSFFLVLETSHRLLVLAKIPWITRLLSK